jgi:outer membrane protein
MKKAIVFGLVFSVMLMSAPLFAAGISIGCIDVQKVFKGYTETSKAQASLSKEEATFKKEFEASQKKLEAAKAAKKSDKEIETMTKSLEEELAPKREKLMKMNDELTSRLQKDILTSVKSVAKNLGLDIVLDKQVIIDGGMDISDMVINKLNSK